MPCVKSFFKFILSSEKMVRVDIPGAVVLEIPGNTVILRDCCGNSWTVEVERNGDRYNFTNGWPPFHWDNSIEAGDVMVFDHRGGNLFDFKLFGENECEKDSKSRMDEEGRKNESHIQTESEEEEQVSKPKLTSSVALSNEDATFGIETMPSRRVYRKKVLDCYGADIFKAGLARPPENRPFFVSRSRNSRKNELYIPKDVIVDYNLKIPQELFLVDEKNRRWKAEMKQWKDGRLWCTQGWRRLCNVNNIQKEDVCTCEFVKRGKDMFLLVKLVRPATKMGCYDTV